MVYLITADDTCLGLQGKLLFLVKKISPTGDLFLEGRHQLRVLASWLILIRLVASFQTLLLLELHEFNLFLARFRLRRIPFPE